MPSAHSRPIARRHLLGLGLGAAASLLAACGGATPASPTAQPAVAGTPASAAQATAPKAATGAHAPTLRLGFQPPYIGVFVMQNQKLLETALKEAGTTVEHRRMLSLNPIVEGMAGGSLDLGMGGPPVGALATGQPIRILALIEKSPKTHAFLVRPDSPVTTVADLRGKKMGNPVGKAYAFPQRVLERAGLKDTDLEWVKLENNEGRSALLTGAIDTWVTWDPFFANAEAAQEARVLVDGEGYHTNYVTLFGHADFVERYPETVKRFLQAYQQALEWVKVNPAEATKIFVDENKVEPAVAELTMKRRSYMLIPPNEEFRADLADQGALFKRLSVIEQEPDWNTVIAPSIAQDTLGS